MSDETVRAAWIAVGITEERTLAILEDMSREMGALETSLATVTQERDRLRDERDELERVRASLHIVSGRKQEQLGEARAERDLARTALEAAMRMAVSARDALVEILNSDGDADALRAIADRALTPTESPPPHAKEVTMERWYLGSMNDGLFIINTPPRPSTDDTWHDRPDGPTMVLNVVALGREQAQAIVDAHNGPRPASSTSGTACDLRDCPDYGRFHAHAPASCEHKINPTGYCPICYATTTTYEAGTR